MMRVGCIDYLAGKQLVTKEKRHHHDDVEAKADDNSDEGYCFYREIFGCGVFIHNVKRL